MQDYTTRNKEAIQQLYNTILPALAQAIHQNLAPVTELFENFVLERVLDTWTKDPAADSDKAISIENGNVQQMGLKLRLEGFNKPGVEPFDITKDLVFKLEYSSYTVGPDKQNTWLEKQYLQKWESSEYGLIAEKWSEEVIDSITLKLGSQ